MTVPEREREAESAFAIRDPQQTIFSPAVSAAPRMLVGKISPRIASLGIVFANGGPLTFGEVGTPPFPVFCPGSIFLQTLKFFVHMLITESTPGCHLQRRRSRYYMYWRRNY